MENIINFQDKVVIITGASSGIGAETAKCFAELGATLSLVGRNEERLMNVAKECKERKGIDPLCLLCDLTHDGSCESVIQKTVERFGTIDVLVNCAGITLMSSMYDQSMDVFDDLMRIGVRVPFQMCQLALPYLLKTKGNIVNISYSMTHKYRPGFMVCGMAKVALEKFSRHAAAELATEGVRVNVVAAGLTRTNILSSLDLDKNMQQLVYQTLTEYLPGGKILEPREIGVYICFVASNLFPSLNGAKLVIDDAASLSY